MRESMLKLRFFETYYYANIIDNVLSNDSDEYLVNMNFWHVDRSADLFLREFPRWSVMHDFARYVIHSLMDEQLDNDLESSIANDPHARLWVDEAFRFHEIENPGFDAWLNDSGTSRSEVTLDTISDYNTDLMLCGNLDKLMTQLANEVFSLLFGNRMLLLRLNYYASIVVSRLARAELPPENRRLLRRDGVPARGNVPEWARRAVFYRDRGRCVSCGKDLTGLVNLSGMSNFDHMIPLSEGGINDVTNLQLLCAECNQSKGKKLLLPSDKYEAWYDMPESCHEE